MRSRSGWGPRNRKAASEFPRPWTFFWIRHAILDADYDAAAAQGKTFWVLSKIRTPTPLSGRHLVIVDTGRDARPNWTKSEVTSGASAAAVRKSTWQSGAQGSALGDERCWNGPQRRSSAGRRTVRHDGRAWRIRDHL